MERLLEKKVERNIKNEIRKKGKLRYFPKIQKEKPKIVGANSSISISNHITGAGKYHLERRTQRNY